MLTDRPPTSTFTTAGKFFSRSGQKFFFKAMRLPDVGGCLDFEAKLRLSRRLESLKLAHTTGLILTEAQSQPVLDIAAQAGMPAMLEFSIAAADLFDRTRWRSMLSRIAYTANILRGYSALAGYIIDCPIRQDELRAAGPGAVQRAMRSVCRAIKRRDQHTLVALKHRPDTRALALLEEDFLYAEVPALDTRELRDFIISLHNIAEARPVVIELGGLGATQDEAVATAFGTGAAGVVAPAVPLAHPHDWLGIHRLRPSELLPFMTLNGSCPPGAADAPMVSVVICAYNAERTMRACLESLTRLQYPNFEVVIVDDGSQDRTGEISMEFPQFRLIRQPNKGLSMARNVGAHAARGEIIAYTDSDCVVDSHWLTFMVRAMQEGGFDGCGGPNYAPHEDGRIEACVAASPGAPSHVLIGESAAEHLAGCNMMFTRAALDRIGGFDPQFTSAGDDVDACWKILAEGMTLGFCPAAFVWHFRRNTISAYYGQQRGYGRAEAMLYARYPERFNALGQIKWNGTIPGFSRTVPGGGEPRIFWGAPRLSHQTVFAPALKMLVFLPQTFEWTALWSIAAVVSIVLGRSMLLPLAMLALGPAWALYYAWHAPLEKAHVRISSRLLIAFLAYTGPMRRTLTRYRTRLKMLGSRIGPCAPRQLPKLDVARRELRLAFWNEQYITRNALLDRLMKLFARDGHPAVIDRGWNDYDLELRPDPWTRVELKTADEEHEGMRLKNHIVARVRLSRITQAGIAAGIGGAIAAALCGQVHVSLAIAALTVAAGVSAAVALVSSARYAYRAIEHCGAEIGLTPLGTPTRAWRRSMDIAGSAATVPPHMESSPAKLSPPSKIAAEQ